MPVLKFKEFVLIIFFALFFSSCRQSDSLLTSLFSSSPNIDFVNKVEEKKLVNNLYYIYF